MKQTIEDINKSLVPQNLLGPASLHYLFKLLVFDWTIILFCSTLMYFGPYYLIPIFVLLIGGRLHGLGVIMHELSHINKKKNISVRTLEVLAGYPIGTSINAMAYHHIRHHKFASTDLDPYFKLNKKCSSFNKLILSFKQGMFFIPFWIIRSFYGSLSFYIPALRKSYSRIFLQALENKDFSTCKEIRICASEERAIAIFHTLLFILALNFHFILFCYYLALPVAGVLCIYRLLSEHEYDLSKDTNNLLENTFDHHTSIWGNILIAPHNIGNHCMHHIHPNVGLQYLNDLRKWYLKNSQEYKSKYIGMKI